MQTFLPYPSFTRSARVLDRQRLGKQRVEVLQLLNAIRGGGKGWANHPAARMWRGHELSLAHYGLIVCKVWRDERGYRDTCYGKIRDLVGEATNEELMASSKPDWFGDVDFHRAHQSNLVRKKPEHYGPLFVGVPDNLEYIWPEVS